MFRNNRLKQNCGNRHDKGASLVMAIFIIVLFSLFAAGLARMIGAGANALSYEVIGTRAYLAAESGNQWALAQLFPLLGEEEGDITSKGNCERVNTATKPNFDGVQGLKNCRIASLSCESFLASGEQFYTITTTGACEAGGLQANRTLQVDARNVN